MNPKPLPRIPTPPALRWREFRLRFMPVLFFALALACVCLIWKHNLSAPTFVGAVEGRSAEVISPCAGKIVRLNVDRFQPVTKGTPVAVLVPSDTRTALSVVQSELDILRAKLDPYLARQRNATDYEQWRMDWMVQKVDLAIARANLQGARDELHREKSLHEQKLVSDETYELARTQERALTAEVLERSNLVQTVEVSLQQAHPTDPSPPANDFTVAFAAGLQAEEQKLKVAAAGTEPVALVAPMDGMVSIIYHQAGENIPEGTPLLVIAGREPERIVAYLRQPVPFKPVIGEHVEVRTRSIQPQAGVARISSVGAQFEPITNVLAVARMGGVIDFGLPVEITLPPGFKVRPGEIVDLTAVSAD